MVDASFGPPHEGYRSVQGIMMTHGGNPIMWASTRQPFITSTAEAELLAYSEAYQCGESAGARLEALGTGECESTCKAIANQASANSPPILELGGQGT